ncbi:TetR family transcriptional regulator [Kineococcus sp. R8]|uniref:TetR/AcrR family transcriptional regulator n=1 Tax=Kineococcus siccus TaxID=2696567 RepID=UPI001412075F|nr:TetR/AcrR family transcriptional regulator [Kineococcus siccus]NAZ82175.1 TetR family transcriptional regulator [Kineococcus siccus]
MTAPATARARARAELTREILDAARAQLATDGADRLSLRAVARELQMVPSGLYRYYASRDDLLTALIVAAYDALGDAADRALAAAPAGDHRRRWRDVCRAVRTWAVSHPHEFALVYGSPVPGYRAPADTVGPATRVYTLLLGVLTDAARAGQLAPAPGGEALPTGLHEDTTALLATLDVAALGAARLLRAITAWTQVLGAVGQEVFGHLAGAFRDDALFFDHTVDLMADLVGLPPG